MAEGAEGSSGVVGPPDAARSGGSASRMMPKGFWQKIIWLGIVPAIFTAIGAVVGGVVIYLVSAEERRQTAINMAWDRIASYSGDPSQSGGGLRRAIEFLANERESLRGVFLYNARLFGLKLPPKTDLNGARLVNTNLQNADMPGVQLNGAWLSMAHLVGANLIDADLGGAIVGEAILDNQSVGPANLEGANLSGANLAGDNQNWRGVNLTKADLTGVRNMKCEKLTQASNWQEAFRDNALACGAEIPTR